MMYVMHRCVFLGMFWLYVQTGVLTSNELKILSFKVFFHSDMMLLL